MPVVQPPALQHFSYEQLRRATGSFSPSHRLGQGGFGPVFRGALPNGQAIAVKLMEAGSLHGDVQFLNELALAEKMVTLDRRWVLPPLGFCHSRSKPARWRRFKRETSIDDDDPSPGRRVLLVYELMHNGSLQDALLDRRCPELRDWSRRFSVALDIARGLQFLHSICDPPVIHGDIKPSNILLDANLSARIADFGLATFKSSIGDELQRDEEDAVEKTKKIEDGASVITVESLVMTTATTETYEKTKTQGQEEDERFSRVEETETSSSQMEVAGCLDVASTSETVGFDRLSVDSETQRSSRKRPGGVLSSKDYVMEWIRSEIKKEPPRSDWIAASSPSVSSGSGKRKASEKRKHQRRLEWWASLDEDRTKKKEKSRPVREWWREEFSEELENKHTLATITKFSSNAEAEEQQGWLNNDTDSSMSTRRKKKRKKKTSGGTGGQSGQDSVDFPKGSTFSSTPSLRGTVCYVAPEFGGRRGQSSEKCDIYSFGVLLLVIISGRRPLQVTASPMSEFERANLISWARQLARLGRLLDLVDPSLSAVDKEQALLCITVALLCIQRSPARRPSSKEIVGMLSGQSEPPSLPLEFSPPPPGKFTSKSRRKSK